MLHRFNLEKNQLPETILFQTNKKGEINGTTFYGAEFSADEIRNESIQLTSEGTY